MNKLLLASALAMTVALTGCNSTRTGSIDPGDPTGPVDPVDPTDPTDPDPTDPTDPTDPDPTDPDPTDPDPTEPGSTTFAPSSGGWAGSATAVPMNVTTPVAAGVTYARTGGTFTTTFSGGPLAGQPRTFTGGPSGDGEYFAVQLDGSDEAIGDLTAFEGNASVAGLVLIDHASGTGLDAYAFHGANPAYTGEHSRPENGTATYSGSFAGTGVHGNPLAGGQAAGVTGNVSLKADFGSNQITEGLISGLVLQEDPLGGNEGEAFGSGNVTFSGTISGGSYAGTATATGWGTTGDVVGGFYGPDAAETAGSVAIRGDGHNSLVGAYQAGQD